MGRPGGQAELSPRPTTLHPALATRLVAHGQCRRQPDGRRLVRHDFGLGFVLSFGYWCTDFLVVQRAMAADSMSAARRTPLIAAFPKMLFPFS